MKLGIPSFNNESNHLQTKMKNDNESIYMYDETKDKELIMIIVSDKNQENDPIIQSIGVHSCNLCAMDFESSNDYVQHTRTLSHINTEKRSQKLQCHICKKEVSKTYIKTHILHHNFKPTEPKEDNIDTLSSNSKSSNTVLETDAYTDLVTDYSKIECEVCHKLISKAYFKNHSKLHNSAATKVERRHDCKICRKSFSYTCYIDHIKRVHIMNTREIPSGCISETVIDRNRVISKPDNCQTPYVCEKCGKVFKKSSGFKLHIMTHDGDLKYKCMFCPYRGLHQGLLKIHIRTHTGDYNYKCSKCPARFITKSNLNKHLKRHMGPGNFKCDKCLRNFYSSPELDRHYKADHLGIKNHVCNICGKAFGYRNAMMCHQLRVHKRKKLTEGKGRLPSYLQAELNLNETK